MHLSIVIPVHNEAANIADLAREINSALQSRYPYEMIFVDDGSTDRTPTLLRELQGRFPSLRFLRHRHSCGQSTALYSGVRAAQNPVIVTMDGDGQNDPADIPKLVDVYRNDPEDTARLAVLGWRKKRWDTAWRRFSSRVANRVRRMILHDGTPDTGCGLKLIPRDLYLTLPYFDHMHRFLPALIKRSGGRVLSVAINHRDREHGRSHYGTFDRLRAGIFDLFGVYWLMKRAQVPEFEEE